MRMKWVGDRRNGVGGNEGGRLLDRNFSRAERMCGILVYNEVTSVAASRVLELKGVQRHAP